MTVPDTMRAALLTGHGGPEMLEVRDDVPVPAPGAGEVLVAVAACGVNNTDVNTRVGWYATSVTGGTGEGEGAEDGSWGGGIDFPRIQGADPVGRIVDAGTGVDRSRIGERVMIDPWLRHPSGDRAEAEYLGSERDGGFAQYVTVPAANAHAVESTLADVELASFPCSYSTAEHMLHRARVAAGQTVLVTGASGGVGGALVQLAKRRGARVLALTSAAKRDAVAALGADATLDRGDTDVAGAVRSASDGGIDVLADVVGGDGFPALFETIRPGGHYTTAGAVAGPIVDLDLRTLYLNDLTMHGATVVPAEVFANLVRYIEDDEIRPVVAGTFPLERITDAQAAFLRKDHVGAFVIEP